MSSNCPPQLHLSLPPNTTSFKRSFEQFGFDLESPGLETTGASGSSSSSSGSTSDGNDRNKRARSASSGESSSHSADSTTATDETIASTGSMDDLDDGDNAESAPSGLSASRPAVSLAQLPTSIVSPQPPRLPTPVIEDIEMSDYVEPARASPPPVLPSISEQYRISLERFSTFDSQISALRHSVSPEPPSPSPPSPSPPTPPPTLPPLALDNDVALQDTLFDVRTSRSSRPSSEQALHSPPPPPWRGDSPSIFRDRLDSALDILRAPPSPLLPGLEQDTLAASTSAESTLPLPRMRTMTNRYWLPQAPSPPPVPPAMPRYTADYFRSIREIHERWLPTTAAERVQEMRRQNEATARERRAEPHLWHWSVNEPLPSDNVLDSRPPERLPTPPTISNRQRAAAPADWPLPWHDLDSLDTFLLSRSLSPPPPDLLNSEGVYYYGAPAERTSGHDLGTREERGNGAGTDRERLMGTYLRALTENGLRRPLGGNPRATPSEDRLSSTRSNSNDNSADSYLSATQLGYREARRREPRTTNSPSAFLHNPYRHRHILALERSMGSLHSRTGAPSSSGHRQDTPSPEPEAESTRGTQTSRSGATATAPASYNCPVHGSHVGSSNSLVAESSAERRRRNAHADMLRQLARDSISSSQNSSWRDEDWRARRIATGYNSRESGVLPELPAGARAPRTEESYFTDAYVPIHEAPGRTSPFPVTVSETRMTPGPFSGADSRASPDLPGRSTRLPLPHHLTIPTIPTQGSSRHNLPSPTALLEVGSDDGEEDAYSLPPLNVHADMLLHPFDHDAFRDSDIARGDSGLQSLRRPSLPHAPRHPFDSDIARRDSGLQSSRRPQPLVPQAPLHPPRPSVTTPASDLHRNIDLSEYPSGPFRSSLQRFVEFDRLRARMDGLTSDALVPDAASTSPPPPSLPPLRFETEFAPFERASSPVDWLQDRRRYQTRRSMSINRDRRSTESVTSNERVDERERRHFHTRGASVSETPPSAGPSQQDRFQGLLHFGVPSSGEPLFSIDTPTERLRRRPVLDEDRRQPDSPYEPHYRRWPLPRPLRTYGAQDGSDSERRDVHRVMSRSARMEAPLAVLERAEAAAQAAETAAAAVEAARARREARRAVSDVGAGPRTTFAPPPPMHPPPVRRRYPRAETVEAAVADALSRADAESARASVDRAAALSARAATRADVNAAHMRMAARLHQRTGGRLYVDFPLDFMGVRARRAGRAFGDYVRDEDFDQSYEGLLSLAATLGDARPRAVPADVLAGLPTGVYRDWATADSDSRCPICLDDYQPDDALLRLPDCTHWLHSECLRQWLKGANTCPVCRRRVGGSGTGGRRAHTHTHAHAPAPAAAPAHVHTTTTNSHWPRSRRAMRRRTGTGVDVGVGARAGEEISADGAASAGASGSGSGDARMEEPAPFDSGDDDSEGDGDNPYLRMNW